MNVLFVITGLTMGGAETQVVSLADKLSQKGVDVTIAYLVGPVVVKPKDKNVKLIWLGGRKSHWSMFSALGRLIKLIRKSNPSVVHSHLFHANILTRVACIFTPVSMLVSTAHNNNESGNARMLAYRLTNRFSDVFTNVSNDAVRSYEDKRAVSKGGMLTVSNGIDVTQFKFSSDARMSIRAELGLDNKKVFIAIGRFHEAKDYPNLIKAFAKVVSCSESHLLIVGDGELRPVIESYIGRLGLQGSITLLGVRKDIPQLLSAADIFVLSSAWEGFGLVVAEAMACGRIVVSTDSGGVANIIGQYGYVVPPRNTKLLAHAMRVALTLSETEEAELGQKARQRILDHFSLDAAVQRWLEIYGI